MKRAFIVVLVCVLFAGACATKSGTQAGPDVASIEAPAAKPGSTVNFVSADTSIRRLEGELRRALSGSETIRLNRKRDILVVTCSSDSMFGFDSSSLKSGVRAEIGQLAEVLYRYPETRIRVEGHTDSIGAAEANQKLSERRADALRNELIERNLQSERIEIAGFGAARPVASNKTPDGRRRNRRIQIFIVSAAGR